MIKSIFTIAWRSMIRNKTFSAINILGLALGMAASLFIFLWIRDEMSIGRQYKNSSTLYRIMEREFTAGKVIADEDTPGILADELKRQFPEVIHAAGFTWPEGHVLTAGEKIIRQVGRYAGPDWFSMYSINLLEGTPAKALNTPSAIAISRKVADSYFGNAQQAIGKSIRFDNNMDYQVTAVFENVPANDPEQYDFLLSWDEFLRRNNWAKDWTNGGPQTRIQLSPAADVKQFEAKLKDFLKGRNTDFSSSFHIELFLQPETKAYLYSGFKNGYADGGRIESVRLLAIVAAFLLLIAGINFTNLATARSVKRAREVGVRKAIGAARSSLVRQFMGEAFLLTLIALVIAITLVIAFLPAFNHLTGKQLTLSPDQPQVWMMLAGLLVVTGILAGSYPAFFLSSLNPVRVLKGALRFGAGAVFFRRGLVVFQFIMSMLLITGTLIVYKQLHYIQTKNIGYDRENLVSIPGQGELSKKYSTFSHELLQIPGVRAVTHAALNPLQNGNTTESVTWPGKDPNDVISFNQTGVWYDFARVLKVDIIQGRDFSPAFADSNNFLINQTAAARIGYKDPVGKPLTIWGKPGRIIGVVKDFHFNSLHDPITPMIIRLDGEYSFDNILVRTEPGKTKEALAGIEALCRSMNPGFPFSYSFIDEGYRLQYKSETIVGTLATVFACLAIFIACLGLFGLAAFTAEQRTKEIGVRKVLGASVTSIVGLLSKDFLKLVIIAIVLATPVAWWVMHEWLQSFSYQAKISWWIFAAAGLLAMIIALITVSFQSIRAALTSPSKSLKTE
ncbi:ABC transporter permease [Paraflavitalea soli]|uniref:ABC transporter permease n=1 Tax=Paraflavitalea soli TaxID=2315862 RepID=A0A3B7MHU7_9BACT|nr:ABC transporter permease [Paraflavitalea soli]AXY73147.1 ABC transporter permease [Paraflavitalea soli]